MRDVFRNKTATIVVHAGHRVRLLDLMFSDNTVNTLEVELYASTTDVVGISLRNIDNNDMQHPLEYFSELLRLTSIIFDSRLSAQRLCRNVVA